MKMHYRPFGQLGWDASALGFGTMRLPVLDGDTSRIDEERAARMLRYAIDAGVNYVDTAYPYHGGKSEECVGRILRDGYREKVKLATKLPVWDVEAYDDFYRYLEIQLKRLRTDTIDLYLIHALNTKHWEKTKQLKLLKAAEKAKMEGLIGHIGFSFHDEYPVFEQILAEYDGWEFCQIQYNFMDTEYQAGRKGLLEAARKGLAVVIMEPLKGGQIAAPPPEPIRPVWEELGADFYGDTSGGPQSAGARNEHVALALQWLWDQPEVSTVLSGMSTFEQVEQNLDSAARSKPRFFSEREKELFDRLRREYAALRKVDCTGCGYCMPCPNGVNIPRNLQLYNELHMYGDLNQPRRVYELVFGSRDRASNCIECGECEEKCPQQIPIIESLKNAHAALQ